ncbi:MAG: hypothetical protein H6581_21295 [Bacteroidia bacterium]|nr:hypothetical protein [Bacteroidia bacterium]
MSCFERSEFLRNHEVVNQELLIQACAKLGWEYEVVGQKLIVKGVGNKVSLHGEPALEIRGNQVVWNRYYLRDGKAKANQLQAEYHSLYLDLQVEYSLETVLKEFKSRGFSYLRDTHFAPNENEKHRFEMKATSKLAGEDEPLARIRFTILADGAIQTDSNYIPEDVHKLADQAMDAIALHMGHERIIRPKEIPSKYRNKAFCNNHNVIKLRQGRK